MSQRPRVCHSRELLRSRSLRRPELMDLATLPLADTERALADLERVNRWLLGLGPAVRTLLPRMLRGGRVQSLLDIGTGSGQVPQAVLRAAARQGVELRVVGVDRKLCHLLTGRRWGRTQMRVVARAEELPFPEAAFDWTLSNLFFHHFGDAANRRILAEMRRVSRRGAAVVDVRRSPLAALLIWIGLRLLRVGYVARNDGWLSVVQAWRLGEVKELAASEPRAELRRRFPFRFSLLFAHGNDRG